MGRSLALLLILTSCGLGTDVAVRASPAAAASPTATAAPTPTPVPTRTATPTATPTPTPAPTPSAAPSAPAAPRGSPTPFGLPTDAGGPRGAEPAGALHYVAIGASDTVGLGSADPATGSWASRVAAQLPPGSTYRNLGVSGSLTAQAQTEQLPTAVREQPSLVTIWLAVNDLNRQVPAQAYGASLGAIVDALVQGTSARIFVGNVPDLRAVPVYAAIDRTALLFTIQSYNAQVAAVAAKHPGRVVTVDLFTGSGDLMSQVTVAADGFHPSDPGYAIIALRFGDAMRKNGVPLRVP